MKYILTKYTVILLIGQLLSWYILYFSLFYIPERIPTTPIKVDGAVFMILIVTVLIFAQKELLRFNSNLSVVKLTLLGTLISFYSEAIFQTIRQFTFVDVTIEERIRYIFLGITVIPLFAALFSFLIAFQLKTKKVMNLFVIAFLLLALVVLIKQIFPSLFTTN